jgi:hypothetical protein
MRERESEREHDEESEEHWRVQMWVMEGSDSAEGQE